MAWEGKMAYAIRHANGGSRANQREGELEPAMEDEMWARGVVGGSSTRSDTG
jgi:hypothetical protein